MIVENEQDGYTLFNVAEFQQVEDNETSQVDLGFSQEMPTNIANMMHSRQRIRDEPTHHQLKADLVEHVWHKFGSDEDDN